MNEERVHENLAHSSKAKNCFQEIGNAVREGDDAATGKRSFCQHTQK
jgi:hypothetical protein